MSQSPDAGQREIAFRIFTTTPGIIKGQHEGILHDAFGKGFKDPDNSVSKSRVQSEDSTALT
jgi:importin-5